MCEITLNARLTRNGSQLVSPKLDWPFVGYMNGSLLLQIQYTSREAFDHANLGLHVTRSVSVNELDPLDREWTCDWGQSRVVQVACDAVPRLVSLPFKIAL